MFSAKPLIAKCKIYDEIGTFHFRRPTPAEQQAYRDSMLVYDKKTKESVFNAATASSELFDLLVTNCDGFSLELADGNVTPFNANTLPEHYRQIDPAAKHWYDIIPVNVKQTLISALFPEVEVIDEKK